MGLVALFGGIIGGLIIGLVSAIIFTVYMSNKDKSISKATLFLSAFFITDFFGTVAIFSFIIYQASQGAA